MNEQLSLFPNIADSGKHTLYVIGNGFDLAHGIKSSYNDFYGWLKDNKYDRHIHLLDIFFNKEESFWKNIEQSLGEYKEEDILSFCSPREIDYEHPMRYSAIVEDSPREVFMPIVETFVNLFSEWVNSIELSVIGGRRFGLTADSIYLTFNYTETLEAIYCIPESRILHIHGNRNDRRGKTDYIFGHNKLRDPLDSWRPSDLIFESQAYEMIINFMNGFVKATNKILEYNGRFFEQLSDINRVVVIGHSLGEIDMPYFEKIKSSVGPNALWQFSWHRADDLVNIQILANKLGLSDFSTFEL